MISMRPAQIDDTDDLFIWRNDTQTREMSLSSEEVRIADHQDWFQKSLRNKNRILLIAYKQDVKLGVTRFDISEDGKTAEISINLNPHMRGNGYAKPILSASLDCFFQTINALPIYAKIKAVNISSIRAFMSVGFQLVGTEKDYDLYVYSKD